MNVKVLKRTSKEIEVEIEGAGHTLCNLLQKRILEQQNVDLAGYNLPHPLASNPIIYIRTKEGTRPETVLRHAIASALDINRAFSKELARALKEK